MDAIYEIPQDIVEQIILSVFNMDKATIQNKMNYHLQEQSYTYHPRGFYESEIPEQPYPEVVGYVDHGDGTITLSVHAVYSWKNSSDFFTHEVTIRPLEDGTCQYVSNHMTKAATEDEMLWHVDRLSEEERNKVYKEVID